MKFGIWITIGMLYGMATLQGCLTTAIDKNETERISEETNDISSSTASISSQVIEENDGVVSSDKGIEKDNYSSHVHCSADTKIMSSETVTPSSMTELSSYSIISSSGMLSSSSAHSSDAMVSSSNTLSSEEFVSSSSLIGRTGARSIIRNYIFGHSLINHQSRYNTSTNELTMVPYWMYEFAVADSREYGFSGQFGFLGQHSNLPPTAQWGISSIPGIWDDDDGKSFSEVDFTTVLLTPANFVQYKPASENNYNDTNSPLGYTHIIFDWVSAQEPGIELYIYENWPDMGGFAPNFDPEDDNYAVPTAEALEQYYAHTLSSFHDWFLEYHNETVKQNPQVKMIPVGPILAKLFTKTTLKNIPVLDLYEDNAPHGTPTLYFLAGMITYMGMYGVPTPEAFVVPESIHSEVGNSYGVIREYIWNELQRFTFESGAHRVFFE
ncbi:MAG: hypothetical protein OCD01_05165 [Fibrobacterales bacterium]